MVLPASSGGSKHINMFDHTGPQNIRAYIKVLSICQVFKYTKLVKNTIIFEIAQGR